MKITRPSHDELLEQASSIELKFLEVQKQAEIQNLKSAINSWVIRMLNIPIGACGPIEEFEIYENKNRLCIVGRFNNKVSISARYRDFGYGKHVLLLAHREVVFKLLWLFPLKFTTSIGIHHISALEFKKFCDGAV